MFNANIKPVYYEAIGEDGPYTALAYGVEAVDKDGNVYSHERLDLTRDQAESLLRRVTVAIRTYGWSPVDQPRWHYDRAAYGSPAYCANYQAEEHDRQKADVENEYGPGSYRPGGPGYLERR